MNRNQYEMQTALQEKKDIFCRLKTEKENALAFFNEVERERVKKKIDSLRRMILIDCIDYCYCLLLFTLYGDNK